MVSKKKRRRELRRAAAQRQAERRAVRADRRRRIQLAVSVTAAILAVAGLGYWIATHRGGGSDVTPIVNPISSQSPTSGISDSPTPGPTSTKTSKDKGSK